MKKAVFKTIALLLCCVTMVGTLTSCGKTDKAAEMFEKAQSFYRGDGVEQDLEKAADLLNKAAKKGSNDARLLLGNMYCNGEGVKQDYEKAVVLFRKAAEDGDAAAQFKLGEMYENGSGVKQSEKDAVKWYAKAADQGNEDAQSIIEEYDVGRRTIRDGQIRRLGPHGWDWEKSYFEDGTMYVYTVNYLSGTMTDASGKESDIYVQLGEDKNGFFILLYNAAKSNLSNTGSEPIAFNTEFVWKEGTKKEYRYDAITGTVAPQSSVVRLSGTATGPVQSSLSYKEYEDGKVYLYFPDGSTYSFEIPNNTDYQEIWDAVSDYWWIPTYNNEIFEGKGVNTDLAVFLQEFTETFEADIARLEKENVVVSFIKDYLDLAPYSDHPLIYEQFMDLENNITRTVDYEYYNDVRVQVDMTLAKLTVNKSSEFTGALGDLADAAGLDGLAGICDLGEGLLGLFGELLE